MSQIWKIPAQIFFYMDHEDVPFIKGLCVMQLDENFPHTRIGPSNTL
jgi:hypothetical protein